MSRRGLSLCAFPALSTVVLASSGETPIAPALANAKENARERGSPALFSWADVDGDGRLDLAAVSGDGTLQLLVDAGDGRFEDVTERAGLAGVGEAALALWADYDGDTRLDLFVGARAGASRLFHNEGGSFLDVSAASGLVVEGVVQTAQWFDHDGDGRLDLFVVTAEEEALSSRLFRGLPGGFFELATLPLGGVVPGFGGVPSSTNERDGGRSGSASAQGRSSSRGGAFGGGSISSTASSPGVTTGTGVFLLMPPPPMSCMDAIKDQANLPNCVQASTTPTLGKLYPITSKLFVAVGGNVGIGTTSPGAKLEVAGTARVTDTLTLAPSGDTALDVSTGSIYKGGALFIHTKGGAGNSALGTQALASVTTGTLNTATGYQALFSNTADANTATGYRALYSNTTGSSNTASGDRALRSNTTGDNNTASGARALDSNTTGAANSAFGSGALGFNTTGTNNTAIGYRALLYSTTGTSNTAIGDRALRANTTGYSNTAGGARALDSNTTGAANSAFGSGALGFNTTGTNNTAIGYRALLYSTTGTSNTAIGDRGLRANTTGYSNTAGGARALDGNTTGSKNSAFGTGALGLNTTGNTNTAMGVAALQFNTTGSKNTAIGYQALRNNGGTYNTAVGYRAGYDATGSGNLLIGNPGVAGQSNTIRIGIGTHEKTYIGGLFGVTPDNFTTAIPLVIDANSQLGILTSSRRFKKDIADMGERTARLLELRPVVFHYKKEQKEPNGGEPPLEYGLIAEEVAEILPDLVVYDEEGEPFTVKYHLMSAMLLNELKRLKTEDELRFEELEDANATLEARLARLASVEAEVAGLKASLATLLEAR